MLKLKPASLKWAIKHLSHEGDSDLFPDLFEISAIEKTFKEFLPDLLNIDLTNHSWDSGRKFIIPKDILSFRNATQLNPLDTLLMTGLLHQYGKNIERGRPPLISKKVFSYRFSPMPTGQMYGSTNHWRAFWEESKRRAQDRECSYVLVTDISDFYNQIYHHPLSNQLLNVGLPKMVVKVIENFLGQITQTVSRGIPIGPHLGHILAEASLIGIDSSLDTQNANYCRYADDFHFFCKTEKEAHIWGFRLAQILEKQQKLILQKNKTYIVEKTEFISTCNSMIIDRPINTAEEELIKVIKKYSNNNPYAIFSLSNLNPQELNLVDDAVIEALLTLYLESNPVNYSRIRWLLRRLTQCGAPGATNFVLENFEKLIPAIGDLTRYLISAAKNYSGEHKTAGKKILGILQDPLILSNEYFQVALLNLFSQVTRFNHINDVISLYEKSNLPTKREILLAAINSKMGSWISERKDDFANSDPWLKRALIFSTTVLPGDEGEHWLRSKKKRFDLLEKIVDRWANA